MLHDVTQYFVASIKYECLVESHHYKAMKAGFVRWVDHQPIDQPTDQPTNQSSVMASLGAHKTKKRKRKKKKERKKKKQNKKLFVI